MTTIEINTFEDLAAYAYKLPCDIDWFREHNFHIDENISGIKIHIKGKLFHSSISTTVMRSILKLQDAIYKQYSLFMYGQKCRLTAEEKEMLEIFVKVEEGSSIFE